MKPLVAKEIRLLLPAFGMALLLAILPAWIVPLSIYVNAHDFDSQTHGSDFAAIIASLLVPPFGLGVIMVALSSFGREFSLKTFSLVLAQPIERKRIWQTKIAMLVVATATLLTALALSCTIRIQTGSGWVIRDLFLLGGTTAIVALSSALWTTLLLRQIEAAVWIATLVPAAILVIIDLCGGQRAVMLAAMGVYAIFGFWLARWQFSRAQEIGWIGGVITFSRWRSANASRQLMRRSRRPLAALIWKELQLHQVGLMAMGGLFVLHLGVVWLRKAGPNTVGQTFFTTLEVFGGFWFIVPLVIGGACVAEERRIGTMQELLCLPVSSRIQFFIKLVFTLLISGLLSAVLFWTAEGVGGIIGGGSDIAELKAPFDRHTLVVLCLGFLGLALIGFYASTLAYGIVQALAAAVATAVIIQGFAVLVSHPDSVGLPLWHGFLVYYISLPTLVLAFLWLSWRNFKFVSENWPFWRRNIVGTGAGMVLIVMVTAAVYNRAWELVVPLEPAHGPARLVASKPVTLKSDRNVGLMAVLPDGRLWVDQIVYDPGRQLLTLARKDRSHYTMDEYPTGFLVGGKWTSLGGNHTFAGSDWMDAATTIYDTIGIRADGTIWVSEKPHQDWNAGGPASPAGEPSYNLVKYGDENNWQTVVTIFRFSAVVLKRNGTLWLWGPSHQIVNHDWPGLRAYKPRLLKGGSDWERILQMPPFIYGWKRDGSAWIIHPPEAKAGKPEDAPESEELVMRRLPELDNTHWRNIADFMFWQVGLREDGTLWTWNSSAMVINQGTNTPVKIKQKIIQIGTDTNWIEVGGSWKTLGGLKADGSLWVWNSRSVGENPSGEEIQGFSPATESPVRVSTHKDWVAVSGFEGGLVSLAADGSLWYWWQRSDWEGLPQPMLAPTRSPSKIENILDGQK